MTSIVEVPSAVADPEVEKIVLPATGVLLETTVFADEQAVHEL